MDQYKVVNTWMVKQHMVVYLDIMASNGLRVKVYMVDRGQYNNVVVYLDIMASIGLRARVYMVDSGHYNVEVHREFCVYYSLVRGTRTVYSLVRGTDEEATWIQVR